MTLFFASYDDSPPPRAETPVARAATSAEVLAHSPTETARLVELMRRHFDFVWRSLRRQGLAREAADDAAQEVFVIAARRIAEIHPNAERSFLFQTARRVGSDARRALGRRREQLGEQETLTDIHDLAPSPEDQLQRRHALELLDRILASMDEKLRTPFVLFELEGLEVKEIAELLEVPTGTAASRLRLAREHFVAEAKRLRTNFGRSA